MAGNKVVLQSHHDSIIRVNFRYLEGEEIPKGKAVGDVVYRNNVPMTLTIPALQSSPKNIRVTTKEDLDHVRQDLQPYLDLGRNKGIVEIDDIPDGYFDPAEQISAAKFKQQAAEAERDGAIKRAETAEAEVVRLKAIMVKDYGWKDDGK